MLEGVLNGGASMVYHVIDEGDVKRIMAHPMTMIASDGRLTEPGDGVPHPRATARSRACSADTCATSTCSRSSRP